MEQATNNEVSKYVADDEFEHKLNILRLTELRQLLSFLGLSQYGAKAAQIERILNTSDILQASTDAQILVRVKATFELMNTLYLVRTGAISQSSVPDVTKATVRKAPEITPNSKPAIIKMDSISETKPLSVSASSVATPPKFPTSITPIHQSLPDTYCLPGYFKDKFNINPFFDYQSTLLSIKLKSTKETSSRGVTCRFEMKDNWYTNNSNEKYEVQVFSYPLKGLSADTNHQWPFDCDIRVNGRTAFIEKPKPHSKKKWKDKITTVSNYCIPKSNSITVKGALLPGYEYVIAVNLMKVKTVEFLVDQVVTSRTKSSEQCLNFVKYRLEGGSDDLQLGTTEISLLDPITRARLSIPTRATTCKHIQCFDLKSYLMMNQRVATWTCPICNHPALYTDLIVDSYLKSILTTVETHITGVEFHPAGHWTVPSTSATTVKRKVSEPSIHDIVDLDDDDDDDHDIPLKKPNTATTNFVSNLLVATIEKELAVPVNNSNTTAAQSDKCFVCGKTQNTKRCSKCRYTNYCGKQCQRMDWPRHKRECREIQKKGHPTKSPPEQPATRVSVSNSTTSTQVATVIDLLSDDD